ncbi:hypothetical protein NMG60_11030980 [Bertholletia excelsa]
MFGAIEAPRGIIQEKVFSVASRYEDNQPKRRKAMSRSAVELDFFRMEKEAEAKPQPSKLFDRRRSFRDIQGVISKLDPGLLKTVIKSGTVDLNSITSKSTENGGSLFSRGSFSVPSTPTQGANLFPALPLLVPALEAILACSRAVLKRRL